MYGLVGLLILIAAFKYPNESDEPILTEHEQHNEHAAHAAHKELSIYEQLVIIFRVLSLKRVRTNFLLIWLITITNSNFEVFIIYSNEEQYGITPLTEGGMLLF
jgi:hypothetical protein